MANTLPEKLFAAQQRTNARAVDLSTKHSTKCVALPEGCGTYPTPLIRPAVESQQPPGQSRLRPPRRLLELMCAKYLQWLGNKSFVGNPAAVPGVIGVLSNQTSSSSPGTSTANDAASCTAVFAILALFRKFGLFKQFQTAPRLKPSTMFQREMFQLFSINHWWRAPRKNGKTSEKSIVENRLV